MKPKLHDKLDFLDNTPVPQNKTDPVLDPDLREVKKDEAAAEPTESVTAAAQAEAKVKAEAKPNKSKTKEKTVEDTKAFYNYKRPFNKREFKVLSYISNKMTMESESRVTNAKVLDDLITDFINKQEKIMQKEGM